MDTGRKGKSPRSRGLGLQTRVRFVQFDVELVDHRRPVGIVLQGFQQEVALALAPEGRGTDLRGVGQAAVLPR